MKFNRALISNVLLLVMFPIAALTTGCGPCSPLVDIYGKDIENFVDRTPDQKEPATLAGNYLFLYLVEPPYSPKYLTEPPYSPKQEGNEPRVRLLLKNSADGRTQTIFEGRRANDIEYGVVLPERRTVVFSLRDWLSTDKNTYLYLYDYEKRKLLLKIMALEYDRFKDKTIRGGLISLDDVILVEQATSICTQIRYEKDEPSHFAYAYHIIDIKTGERRSIDAKTFKRLEAEGQAYNGVKYESVRDGEKLKLFSVYQYHDIIRENPKRKYNGIYINDGKNNIRISRLDGMELLKSHPIWVDNDRKIILGRYLLDVEGKQKTTTLIDGKMLYAAEVKAGR